MKYSKTRKLNLSLYGGPRFETIDLCVEGCSSQEEADRAITNWCREEVQKLRPKPEKANKGCVCPCHKDGKEKCAACEGFHDIEIDIDSLIH